MVTAPTAARAFHHFQDRTGFPNVLGTGPRLIAAEHREPVVEYVEEAGVASNFFTVDGRC
jgi:hypothetical protein